METVTKKIKYGYDGKGVYVYEASLTKLTVREVYEALKENGFTHLRGEWLLQDYSSKAKGKIVGACILGQAALNLNLLPEWDIETEAKEVPVLTHIYRTSNNSDVLIERLNEYTLSHQLNRFGVPPDSKWHTFGNCAQTIIHWNDKGDENGNYALPTYKDVLDMAYDVLKPHFKKVIYVISAEYDSMKIDEQLAEVGAF